LQQETGTFRLHKQPFDKLVAEMPHALNNQRVSLFGRVLKVIQMLVELSFRGLPMKKILFAGIAAAAFCGALMSSSAKVSAQIAAAAPSDERSTRLESIESENARLRKENAALREQIQLRKENSALKTTVRAKAEPSQAFASASTSEQVLPDNKRLPVKGPTYTVPAAAVYSWTGFYAGVGVGMKSTRNDASLTSAKTAAGANILAAVCGLTPCVSGESFDGTAPRFSGYVGYNWQFAPQAVVGVEADLGWAKHTTTLQGMSYPGGGPGLGGAGFGVTGQDSFAVTTNWDASIRARAGYLITPSFLIYATAGAEWLNFESSSICTTAANSCLPGFAGPFNPLIATDTHTKLAPTFGGGFETMLSNNWLARAEYRYSDFGTVSNADTRTSPAISYTATYNLHVRSQSVIFGIAHKLYWE
jgi:opacity protein-like surface antigen